MGWSCGGFLLGLLVCVVCSEQSAVEVSHISDHPPAVAGGPRGGEEEEAS